MESEEQKYTQPFIAVLCQIVAWICLVVGNIMLLFAMVSRWAPGAESFILSAIALTLSSLVWFAIARVILFLACIAYNTSR
jgi:hypothetical protein